MPVEVLEAFDNADGRSVVALVVDEHREIFLTIGGEKAYQTGFRICDTCRYIFNKLVPAQRLTDGTTEEVAAQLSRRFRNVTTIPDRGELATYASVLDPGTYSVVLTRLNPRLVMPGSAEDYFSREAIETWEVDPYFGVGHWPNTPYYRLGTGDLGPVEYGGKRLAWCSACRSSRRPNGS